MFLIFEIQGQQFAILEKRNKANGDKIKYDFKHSKANNGSQKRA